MFVCVCIYVCVCVRVTGSDSLVDLLNGFAVPAVMHLGSEVDDAYMGGLVLFTLGRDGAEAVGHFIAFLRHILPLNAAGREGSGV